MNKLILLTIITFLSLILLCSCSSTSNITIINEHNKPVKGCMLLISQSNMLYINSHKAILTNSDGKASFSMRGLVNIYAGMKGYDVSHQSTVDDAEIILKILPQTKQSDLGSQLTIDIANKCKGKIATKWIEYFKKYKPSVISLPKLGRHQPHK
jgi:hypothetical protein